MYNTIMLPVVLYECQTCYLTLREEHKIVGAWEQDAKDNICNIWIEEGGGARRLEKSAQWGAS